MGNREPDNPMEQPDGYTAEEVTFDTAKANVKALTLMLLIAMIVGIPFFLLWRDHITVSSLKAFVDNNKTWMMHGTVISILVMIAGIAAHELIHGLTWSRFAKKGFASIRFGVLWKEMTPYCHCNEPLSVRHYIIGALMPAVVLGIIPSLIALASGNVFVMAFGLFFTAAAAGDFMIIGWLRKENPDDRVQDHPSKIGYYIFRKT